jgi:hypothetical protein
VTATLAALRNSPATAKQKVKFILATDGKTLESESLAEDSETVACDYPKFPDHFGFFLPLAGITTVKQIRENAFDIRAMNTKLAERAAEKIKPWANGFPYVNGGLFGRPGSADVPVGTANDKANEEAGNDAPLASHSLAGEDASVPRANEDVGVPGVPRFSKIARSYLLHVGSLDWTKINPDIFGSMIQAVADDEERGTLGMHYTSVPNILKALNPLFLDELRARLEEAGHNANIIAEYQCDVHYRGESLALAEFLPLEKAN